VGGFPLGPVLSYMKSAESSGHDEMYRELEGRFGISMYEHPKTFRECVATDYNTYRIDRHGDVIWYDGCSATNTAHQGVVQCGPLEIGLSVVRANFMSPASASESSAFQNRVMDAYPVVFPFHRDQKRGPSAQNRSKFVYHGQQCDQLQGVIDMRRSVMNDSQVQSSLRGDTVGTSEYADQQLQPVIVYLSGSEHGLFLD
jgi:hypothetical protein